MIRRTHNEIEHFTVLDVPARKRQTIRNFFIVLVVIFLACLFIDKVLLTPVALEHGLFSEHARADLACSLKGGEYDPTDQWMDEPEGLCKLDCIYYADEIHISSCRLLTRNDLLYGESK